VCPTADEKRRERHEHTVLVIDDNPDILRLMEFLLRDAYDLLFASSAEEGLQLLQKRMPDVIVSDVMMPGLDGHELCRRLKADPGTQHIPVMLVTAKAEAQGLVQGIDSGADDYLPKPFDAGELRARIRSLLRMRSIEAQLARANKNLKTRADDLVERQRELFMSTVKSLVSALDAKDEYTHNHSLRVTEYSLAIARKLDLGRADLEDLELAGLLHDVGKIGVPETVLHKPDKLTPAEFACIQAHPTKGEAIVSSIAS